MNDNSQAPERSEHEAVGKPRVDGTASQMRAAAQGSGEERGRAASQGMTPPLRPLIRR